MHSNSVIFLIRLVWGLGRARWRGVKGGKQETSVILSTIKINIQNN